MPLKDKHPYFIKVILIYIYISITLTAHSQLNCPFIWPIDGGSCGDCSPSGWDNILTSDMVNGQSWFVCPLSGVGQSPTGGNSALFYGTSNNSEGITTTIGGLVPGNVYNIAFYWTQVYAECPGGINFGGGNLNIIIEGTLYEFSGADDWEIAELCYTATSTSAELTLTIDSNDPGLILVDSAECEDLETCCDLEVDVNRDITLCPGDVFHFEGEYENEQGAVSVEWESFPDDGVEYLSDRFTLNPSFQFPDDGNFSGENYIFTLIVNDVICERSDEFSLRVSPSNIPEFEISLCEVFPNYELPTTSIDGYTGSWEGDFNFDELAGTTQEYIFTLDTGQDNCVESHIYELYIEVAEPVEFELVDSYCGLDKDTYFIEFTSDNGVEGTWDVDGISPDRLTPDYYTYTFTPDPNIHCAFNFEYNFEIREADSLTFNIPSTFCILQNNYTLPTASIESIQGDWEFDEINISALGDDFQIMFEPEDIEDCYYPYVHLYEVTNNINNTFDIPSTLCENIGSYNLLEISNEGYHGVWSPAWFSFDTIFNNEVTSTWSPTPGQSECLVSSEVTISIEKTQLLFFDLSDTLCNLDSEIILPIVDVNNIPGHWVEPTIDPNVLGVGEYVYEFIPEDEYCADSYFYTFNIVEEVYPQFSLVTGFCPSQSPITLPLISDDGISGEWTIATIDPSTPNLTSIQSTFIPYEGQEKCLLDYTETFTIDLLIDPEFDLAEIICSNDLPLTLPESSLNGIVGTWNIPVLFNTIQSQSVNLIFTPEDLSCYSIFETGVAIIHLDKVEYQVENPSDCFAEDGFITFSNDVIDLEYSLDDGLTWISDYRIGNLPSGNYTIRIRSQSSVDCERLIDVNLLDPQPVFFISVDSMNISSCETHNGQIICEVNLSDVEFSIDMGINWQTQSIFNNLSPGLYTIIVRNAFGESCRDTTSINILDFPRTIINDTVVKHLSECSISNGSILITSEGRELEYSIDGENWTRDNFFEGLEEGEFCVYTRSTISIDCIDSVKVELLSVELPLIDFIEVVNPSDCEVSNGMITVNALGISLEYSIDNGTTWQINNEFSNLSNGSYNVIIREVGTETCLSEETVIIKNPEVPSIDDIIIIDATECFPSSGNIEVVASHNLPLEYSLDNGLTWQTGSIFDNLSAGDYSLLVRPVLYPNCYTDQVFNIETLVEEIEIIDQEIKQPSDCVEMDASVEVICNLNDLEYSIDNGISWQLSNTFLNIPDGNYTILIRKVDIPDCSTAFLFEIIKPECPCDDLDVEIDIGNITCISPESGFIALENISGFYTNENYEIEWSNGETTTAVDNLAAGWYTYTISYDQNCKLIDSVFIESFDPITFGLLAFDKTCTDSAYIEVHDFMGGNGSFSFSIDGSVFQDDAVFYNVAPDDYQVIVMDYLDCYASESITLNSNLDLSLAIDEITPIYIGESIILNPLINQTTIDSFIWMPEIGFESFGQLAIEVYPRETTEYTLTIYYGDCVETRSVLVEVIDNRTIFIANTFSVNSLENDVLFIQGPTDLDVEIESLSIYDRWGNLIFHQKEIPLNDRSYGWDGYYNGKLAQIGVYTYLINYKLRGQIYREAGTITLLN